MKNNSYQKILNFSKSSGVSVKQILDFLFSKNDKSLAKSIVDDIKKEKFENSNLTFKNFKFQDYFFEFLKDENFKNSYLVLQKYQKYFPKPNRKLDQFLAKPQTVAKRASLLNFLNDLESKKILFLGDDDFGSVASSKINNAEQVTVLDIDNRILHSIKNISNLEKLNIETFKYDVKFPLPDKFTKKYDVVFADPPYTPKGFNLFLSRAIDALDLRNNSARIYICFGNSDRARERFLPIYDILQKSGLMIRFIFDKFNVYQGADSIGNASSLFICDVTPKTKSLLKGKINDDIYTG
ncbi:MAG: bis-aminopropyl spermidine synthase family protein [Candidatus Woesebacteria bacterium]|nr:MAG: bis-aminopropyl spermidine synthase family protein [Candidatus Woesebacteria bacterium]